MFAPVEFLIHFFQQKRVFDGTDTTQVWKNES